MTVTAVQGLPATLLVQFYQYPGGPATDVTNLTVKITRASDGTVVLGPTGTGIVHGALGVYTYTWNVPANTVVGEYVAAWVSTEASAGDVVDVLPASTSGGIDDGPCSGWDQPIWSCALDPAAQAVTGTAVQAASDVLYALTGRHLGLCQQTIRPCRQSCWGGSWPYAGYWWEMGVYPRPVFYSGVWYNLTCGGCGTGGCSCSVVEEALLPTPVVQVLQVKVDGVILDPGAYRVDDNRLLVRTDGGRWPVCNDLTKADTEVGTWSVTLTTGERVSTLGQMALGELATQFAKLLACNEDCLIPKPVQQIVRQGVTMNFLDPNLVFTEGRLGLYLCDLFISTNNPHQLTQASEWYDVDAGAGGDSWRRTNT